MNLEKIKRLQAQAELVRIGGKGTPRRKKKVVHQTAATDDKKLQSSLKKLAVNNIPGIEEVNMIKNDGTVIHFNNPKTQASLASNTFAITGHGETKQIAEMLPGILSQLGNEGLAHLKRLANNVVIGGSHKIMEEDEKDDIPDLVENFETVMNTGVEAPKVAAAAPAVTPAAPKPSATDKKVEEIVAATIAEAKKPETKPAAAAATPVEDKKDAKKETPKKADKKSNEKGAGGGNKQSGKNKKA